MLRDEIARYTELSGNDGLHTPIGIIGAYLDGYEKGRADAPQWIPVTEQTLPNHNSVVVVCGEKGTWDFGTYRGHASTNIFFWNWKNNTVKECHWWMYKEDALPKPYKRSEDENNNQI